MVPFTEVCSFNEKSFVEGGGGDDEEPSGNTVLIMSLIRPPGGLIYICIHLYTNSIWNQSRDNLPKMVNRI